MTPMRCLEYIRESMEEMLKENQRLREEIGKKEAEITDLRKRNRHQAHAATGPQIG